MKILNVVGTRPNFVKMAPIVAAIGRRPGDVSQVLVHTGQHFDDGMSARFFRDLCLPSPHVNLEIGPGTHADQTGRTMLAFEPVLAAEQPDWLLVAGDVNSTLACALVASKLRVRIAHVEAGLRSFDWSMPEEVNRVLTDRLADLLLTPSVDADENLQREGIGPEKIVRVGNVMIDSLLTHLDRARQSSVLDQLKLKPGAFATLTMHRPSNVDGPDTLRQILAAIGEVARELPVIFPAHPRTQARMREFGITPSAGIRVVEPMGYLDLLCLWSSGRIVLTDSGGLQEETTALGIPCLTLRDNTERPITVEQGTNRLVGQDPARIKQATFEILRGDFRQPSTVPELWDGQSAERIVEALISRTTV